MNTIKSKNKLLATMTIMLLFASTVLAVVPLANAVTAITISASTGNVGDKISVTGNAEYPGSTISIYWHSINPGNLLNSTQLVGSGLGFNLDVTIPAASRGTYGILAVEVLASGAQGGSAVQDFVVEPKITLTPSSGIAGDTFTVTGSGFTYIGTASADLNTITFTFGGTAITSTPATVRTNADGSFSTTLRVPTGTADGSYAVVATGTKGTPSVDTATANFNVGPTITFSPVSGPSGTVVTINGRGFTPGNYIGDFQMNGVTMPKVVANEIVLVRNDADRTFSVQVIVPSGPNSTNAIPVGLAISVTEYTDIGLLSASGKSASETFTLTGVTGITANRVVAKAGDVVTVTGSNFTHISGTQYNLRLMLGSVVVHEFGAGSLTASGSFSLPVTVSVGIPAGLYTLDAIDTYGLTASMPFGIATTTTTVTPTSAVSGQQITITGTGFGVFDAASPNPFLAYNSAYTLPITARIVIDGVTVASGLTAAQLAAGRTVIVPTVSSTGVKTVEILTNIPGLSSTATLDITKTTTLTVSPQTTIAGRTVAIEGTYFGVTATTATIDIQAPNGTKIATLTATIAPDATSTFGKFSTSWLVPLDAPNGQYVFNATDNLNPKLYANGTKLTVTNLQLIVETCLTEYYQGDVGSFTIGSTTVQSGTIAVVDSTGVTVRVIPISDTSILWAQNAKDGLFYYMGTDAGNSGLSATVQFQIPAGAKIGNWTWKATFDKVDDPITGKFAVLEGARGGTGGGSSNTLSVPQRNEVINIVNNAINSSNLKGDKGDKGDPGSSGSSGGTGPAGAQGAQGPAGPAGTNGRDGVDGADGSSSWSSTALVLAIVALVVGAVAAFLAITLRRNIAK